MDAPDAPECESVIYMDRNALLDAAEAPHGDESSEIDLAMLNPDPDQIRMIQSEAVKSAILSVVALRQGRRRHDSLTLSEWSEFGSAPRFGVLPEG